MIDCDRWFLFDLVCYVLIAYAAGIVVGWAM